MQSVITESWNTFFIALKTASSKSTFMICMTRKNTNYPAELTNNNMLFLYPVKEQKEPDMCSFYAMFFQDLSVSYTTWGNCLGQFLNVLSIKQEIRLLSKYSQFSPAKRRIIFPESQLGSIRRMMELFAMYISSSENIISVSRILVGTQNFSPFFTQLNLNIVVFCYFMHHYT